MGDRNSDSLPDNSFKDGDPRRLDVNDSTERAYWCKSLGVSESELLTVVSRVGASAQKVKDALRGYPPAPGAPG